MGFDITGIGSIFDFGSKILDKIIPDKNQSDELKLKLLQLQQNGELDLISKQLSAIITEAQSNDPYTARARPTFLYVMYILILCSLPFGIMYIFNPQSAASFVTGFKAFFEALPEELYWLFGTGYLGYTGSRSFEKVKKFKNLS